MTADAYLVLRCDAEDPTEPDGRCGTEHSWPTRVENHTELRRLLKTRGWRRPRPGRDICPEHASEDPVLAPAAPAQGLVRASQPEAAVDGGTDELKALDLAFEFRIPVPDSGAGGYAEIVVHRERGGTDRWAVTDGALTGRQAWVEGQGWQYISDVGRAAAYVHPRDQALLLALRVAEAEAARCRTETAALRAGTAR